MTRCRIAPYRTPTQLLQRNSSNILLTEEILPQLRLVVYPTIYRVFSIPGGERGISSINSHLEISRSRNLVHRYSSFFRSGILWIDLRLPCSFVGETDSCRFFFLGAFNKQAVTYWTDFSDTFFGELPVIVYLLEPQKKLLLSIYWLFKTGALQWLFIIPT